MSCSAFAIFDVEQGIVVELNDAHVFHVSLNEILYGFFKRGFKFFRGALKVPP